MRNGLRPANVSGKRNTNFDLPMHVFVAPHRENTPFTFRPRPRTSIKPAPHSCRKNLSMLPHCLANINWTDIESIANRSQIGHKSIANRHRFFCRFLNYQIDIILILFLWWFHGNFILFSFFEILPILISIFQFIFFKYTNFKLIILFFFRFFIISLILFWYRFQLALISLHIRIILNIFFNIFLFPDQKIQITNTKFDKILLFRI